MVKIISHETTMRIPISNTLNDLILKKDKISNNKAIKINFKKLNDPQLKNISSSKFPAVNIISKLPSRDSLFETILVSANDEFVSLFLQKKITYTELLVKLMKFISKKRFSKYKTIAPYKINDILELNQKIKLLINPA